MEDVPIWQEKERNEQYPKHDGPITLVRQLPEMEHDVIVAGWSDRHNGEDEWLKYTGPMMERKDWRQE